MKTILSQLRACSFMAFAVYCFSFASFYNSSAHAQMSSEPTPKHYLLAQTDPDEAFDPFTDYSEFDEESDEEADINFFRNGRFFTVGLAAGYRAFTGGMGQDYTSAATYGLFLSYFFDLRFALQLGFMTGDHNVAFSTLDQSNGGKVSYTGNVSMTSLNVDLKYYLNTQNVTRGLADLNPYIIGGMGEFYRTYTISGLDGYNRDSAMGVDAGIGLEIPIMRKKAFFGIQATYHYVNFNDENKAYLLGTEKLDHTINGDPYDLLAILGMNF